jgi:predicted pyridoxine 5'-phosphate oxidase superfamily flavin-nucleotide-binding protein
MLKRKGKNQMVSLPQEVMDLLSSPDRSIYKAIVTVNAEGIPNNAPMGTIRPIDSETIIFGDVFLVKTRENLEGKNKKVVIVIYKAPLTAYQVKGTFVGFQTSGPIYDNFSKTGTKTRLKAVGLVKVDEVYSSTPGDNSKKLA